MKKVFLSNDAHPTLTSYLRELGYAIEVVNHPGLTYHPVCTHPDIFMCQLGLWENHKLFPGNPNKIQPAYPANILYNAVCTEKFFIHNLKYTDPKLIDAAKAWKSALCDSSEELTFLNVSQGYTRCCCLPVDDSSFITSDNGIAKALTSAGADVLVIEKGHILLPGFNYGFIGGCAGHLVIDGNRTIVFNGNLSVHPDYHKIANFIHERNIALIYFEDYPLTDIGSILTI